MTTSAMEKARTQAAPRKQKRSSPTNKTEIPWRERPVMTVQLASQLSGVSLTTLYRLANKGDLIFRRIAGRVVVETPSLIRFIENADAWTPVSTRGQNARARRSEIARANWAATAAGGDQ